MRYHHEETVLQGLDQELPHYSRIQKDFAKVREFSLYALIKLDSSVLC